MLHNNTNNNNNVNESMPGSMPGSIPQENNNNTQFQQQGQEGLNQQTKPSIIGGPHKIQSGILNHGFSSEHDNVNNNNSLGQNHGEHNYKTDAGLAAGGAAAAGLAGHELKNHHNKNGDNNIHNPLHNTNEGTNPLNIQDSHRTLQSHHKGLSTANATQSGIGNNEHHHRRDTALATGAAGLGGHELKNHHNQTPTSLNNNTNTHFDGVNTINPSSEHQDRSSIPTVHDNEHHTRDNVLAGGAAGVAGHELQNHHNQPPTSLNINTNTHFDGVNTINPSSEHQDRSSIPTYDDKEHHARDNVLAGGAAAATVGVAGHELKNHHSKNSNPLNASHHEGSNPLHNEHYSIPGSHGNNNEHQYGCDTALPTGAVGAAGLAGHEIKDHHNKDSLSNAHREGANPLHHDFSRESSIPGSHDGKGHQYGRDAAIATGATDAAGAAGVAGHELKNHHNSERKGTNPHDYSREASISQDGKDHHYGHDAAVAGGVAAAAGVAGHELKGHHKKKENGSVASNNSGDEYVTAGTYGEKKSKPLNTEGDEHHIAEQKALYLGGLTGQQPVGEINFKKL